MLKQIAAVLSASVGISIWMSPLSNAETLPAIQQRGYLIVAVKDNLPPLGFKRADGQLQGLEIDIARRLAQELFGRPDAIVLKPVQNVDRLSTVLNGQADIAIARMTATASRSRLVNFSVPYYLDGTALITSDASVRQVSEIGNRTIAVLANSSTIATLRYRLPAAQLLEVESYAAAQSALERGAAIAFAADASVLSGWVQELPQYRLLLPSLSVEPLAIAVPKGLQHDELRRQINAIVERWQTNGWLEARLTYWKLP